MLGGSHCQQGGCVFSEAFYIHPAVREQLFFSVKFFNITKY
jgi:hypothetical protein